MTLLWATLNTVLIVRYALGGKFTPAFAGRRGCMMPFLAVGILLGEPIHRRVDPLMFRKTVFGVRLAVGLSMPIA